MLSLGCIQALQCNQNTCPTGVTSHDKKLQSGLVPEDKAQRVANYHRNLVHDVEMIAHSCGAKDPRQLRREHIHQIMANGQSVPITKLHPYPTSGY